MGLVSAAAGTLKIVWYVLSAAWAVSPLRQIEFGQIVFCMYSSSSCNMYFIIC